MFLQVFVLSVHRGGEGVLNRGPTHVQSLTMQEPLLCTDPTIQGPPSVQTPPSRDPTIQGFLPPKYVIGNLEHLADGYARAVCTPQSSRSTCRFAPETWALNRALKYGVNRNSLRYDWNYTRIIFSNLLSLAMPFSSFHALLVPCFQ